MVGDISIIQHYPKSQKYISLFPPEVRQGDISSTPATEEAAKTAQTREEIRSWVRSCMEKGELLMVPDIDPPPELKSKTKQKDWRGLVNVKKPDKTKAKSKVVLEEEGDAIEQDDFFGDDEDSWQYISILKAALRHIDIEYWLIYATLTSVFVESYVRS